MPPLLEPSSVFVVAEIGVNHGGSIDTALDLVDAAVETGADAVKFQSFHAEALVTTGAPKAPYQAARTGGGQTQYDMLRSLELGAAEHQRLAAHCESRGIEFMSSPFDLGSLQLLIDGCAVARVKLGSGELTHGPLLLAAARTGLPLIVSTGMASMDEIAVALKLIAFGMIDVSGVPTPEAVGRAWDDDQAQSSLSERVTLLQCTSAYPAPVEDVNLKVMDALQARFGLDVGYSDHTVGIAVAIAAVARGARVVEKHFTLDRGAPGPDHAASCEPAEFAAMVRGIREVEAALGDGCKRPSPSEAPQRELARRSLVARHPIAAGTTLRAGDMIAKRPGGGSSPMRYWDFLGRVVTRDLDVDDPIDEVDLEWREAG